MNTPKRRDGKPSTAQEDLPPGQMAIKPEHLAPGQTIHALQELLQDVGRTGGPIASCISAGQLIVELREDQALPWPIKKTPAPKAPPPPIVDVAPLPETTIDEL